ncbi:MAG TPA: hypothetical protein VGR93_14760 [Candidatus Acidoferrales bacterium]|nr:hypothetical protein [Candidatus Acidoferrales bacterium]
MARDSAARRVNMKWYIVIAGAIFFVLLVYSSFHQSVFQVEACVDFRGRSHCAQASGRTQAAAIRSAEEIDCQLIADGRDENIACLDQQPSSVRNIPAK